MSAPGKINDEVVIAGLLPALTESTVNENTKTKTWFESVGINPKTFREQAWVLNGLYWFMSDGFRVGVRDGSFGGLDYQTNVGISPRKTSMETPVSYASPICSFQKSLPPTLV